MASERKMLSIAATVTAEYTIKKSRFVVHCSPVADQAATLDFYHSVADPSASHNCWAWVLQQTKRFNDDGEPAGTAGKPILSAIEGKGLSQVMVVVTRYFGGIMLGVGGLIRAYGGSAASCLDTAEWIEHYPSCQCRITAAFEHTGAVHLAADTCEATKLAENFAAEGLQLLVEVRLDRLRQLQNLLRDSTSGAASLHRL
ncbi:MAG TPA: YigZ family protein [Xanthomonadales bacterium]|nr:YigZ family protein [Xanthomonadales bacterium]